MPKIKFLLLLMIFVPATFVLSGTASANPISVVIKETRTVISEFKDDNLSPHTQIALNALIHGGIHELRKKHFNAEADRYEQEWNDLFGNYFHYFRPGIDAIGDHAPLSEWLVHFYNDLEIKIGDTTLRWTGLSDINTLNYVIPVVFQPRGDSHTGDKWSEAEYRLHFVAFMGIVVYWSAEAACTLSTSSILTYLCSFASDVPSEAVRTIIAPTVSDFIYRTANGHNILAPELDLEEAMSQIHQTL